MTTGTVSELDPAVAVPRHSSPIPPVRRVAGALSLPAVFVALLATGPLDPLDDGASTVLQLQQAAGHSSQVSALALVELVAAALLLAVVLAIAGRTRGRGQVLADVGVVLGVLGGLALTLISMHHVQLAALEGQPPAVGSAVMGRLDAIAMPVVLPLMLCAPIAIAVLAAAGWRAGFVPVPAFALMMAFVVTDFIPVLPMGELIPLLLGLVGFGWTAVELLRTRG